jgi:hypothetical protein
MFDTRLDWREVINFNQGIRYRVGRDARCWEIEQNARGEDWKSRSCDRRYDGVVIPAVSAIVDA